MKSVMRHLFQNAPQINTPRSTFDLSHGYKSTFDAGRLIPFFVCEYLPGDTFNVNANVLLRLATPLYPIMDNMRADIHYFASPNRQVWDNWRKFLGEQTQPTDSIDYTIPESNIPVGGFIEGSVADYMGLPTKVAYGQINTLPNRHYWHIYNEWYRHENILATQSPGTGNGPDPDTWYNSLPYRRTKRFDYFTQAAPWPQKGDVTLDLGADIPVLPGTTEHTTGGHTDEAVWRQIAAGSFAPTGSRLLMGASGTTRASTTTETAGSNSYYPTNLYAEISSATSTVNMLRQAVAIQRLLERDARGGTRMAEIIKSHFNVDFLDVSYRPEYIGGGTINININPVTSSYDDGTTNTVGDLSGAVGTGSGRVGFTKSFMEHGYVIGIISVRADLTYQQGMDRHFTRSTRYDYYWPELAAIGEQGIENREIYVQGGAPDVEIFGYVPRYDEYRTKLSKVTGAFRSNAAAPLDAWHLSQEFSALPTLDQTFIEENPPLDRAIKVPSEPHFIMDSYIDFTAARPMPVYGVPGMSGHF